MNQPTTATELIMKIRDESRQEIFKWLQEGGIEGKEIELNLTHFDAGVLGTLTAKITGWKPPHSPNPS